MYADCTNLHLSLLPQKLHGNLIYQIYEPLHMFPILLFLCHITAVLHDPSA